jgi:hypothetical protein
MLGYVIAVLLGAVVLASGVASCEHKKVVALEVSIEASKEEAERLLNEQLAKNAKQAAADKIFAANIQKDYDEKLKEILDRPRDVKYAAKLRDPGGQSSSCTQAGTAPQAQVPLATSAGCELSDAAGIFLRSQADTADTAAIYAQECRAYAYRPEVTSP